MTSETRKKRIEELQIQIADLEEEDDEFIPQDDRDAARGRGSFSKLEVPDVD